MTLPGRAAALVLLVGLLGLFPGAAVADAVPYLTLASTTSTDNSGLYDWLLPRFREHGGIEVRVVAVGTGQAIRLAERGDADVLIVHHRDAEERFVAEGFGVERHDLMYNDFIVVGPAADPGGIDGGSDVVAALATLARERAPFVSRGDDSGTHRKERQLWQQAGLEPWGRLGTWYRESGTGMGGTLNIASAMGAYTLTDRGTWLSFKNRGDLGLRVENDPRLMNPYGVIAVSEKKHPHVKRTLADRFIAWLLSDEGQGAIAAFRVGGEVLFRPGAPPDAVAATRGR